ncbi:spore germination protein [Paenibacillus piri]|uniref:Spore germination protein n=1 Tax=Paenibacillus piri TaxID=2547395 RepID=A0A4R5KXZ7_9BACL|nr:spore germination protein [Paenibacillus piri]
MPAWTKHTLKELFVQTADVQIQVHRMEQSASSEIMLIFAEGLCESAMISKVVLPQLHYLYQEEGFDRLRDGQLFGSLPLIAFEEPVVTKELIVDSVFQGDLLMLIPETNALFKMNICHRPGRSPEESSTEISIKGPKDGFVEDLPTNIALIRKRIRSNSLYNETFILGTRTRTKVSLLYFHDIISPKVLNEVRTRLNKVDMDGMYSIAQLEEQLSDVKYTLFPLLDFSGRPDYAVSALLAGRFVVVVDGNPSVLIGPASFALVLKSPEDIHFTFQYVSFARLIRLLSFWLSALLPGFWVSLVAFHQDQLPFRLMATISVARIGLPFSAQMEMFVLLLLLEIFREAGVRLPSSIGQTLTVVGGLVIGDASIRSGLVSPSVVVVGAITAITGATLVNQSLSTIVSIIRLIIFGIANVLGMYGMILSVILLLFYMSKLHSFGVPYMAPFSPLYVKDFIKAYLRLPWKKMVNRPKVLNTIDPDHQGDDSK